MKLDKAALAAGIGKMRATGLLQAGALNLTQPPNANGTSTAPIRDLDCEAAAKAAGAAGICRSFPAGLHQPGR